MDFSFTNSLNSFRYFTLINPVGSASIRANYGTITAHHTFYPQQINQLKQLNKNDTVDNGINNNSQAIILNGELSAHLVTKEVRKNNPVLRVLFYVGHSADYIQKVRNDFIDKTLCAALLVQHQGDQLVGVCNPNRNKERACLAEVILPSSWWGSVDSKGSSKQQKANFVKISYTASHTDHCIDSAFRDKKLYHLTYLSKVAMIPFSGNYEEITDDNIVTILLPQEPAYPNSKVYIPVRFNYNPEYPLAAFSLRIKVKNGIRILGAQLSQPSKGWQISVEVNHKQNVATVTAYIQDYDVQHDDGKLTDDLIDDSDQEVYSWLLEIDSDIDVNDAGRIVWQVLYFTDSSSIKLDFDEKSSKLTSRLNIQKDDILDVFPITRSKHLLNTACLNGHQVSQAMRVYMVSMAGHVSDVTLQSSCFASDESILKVSPSCTSIYLDGSEIRGSQNATIFIKYGTYTGTGNFIVWMPKLPLEIKLSDKKLSQIKGWRIPHLKHKKQLKSHVNEEKYDQITNDEDNDIGCRLRYQQTNVEVLTKFFSVDHDSGREAYFLNRKLSVKVTDLVLTLMQLSDSHVAVLRGNIIEGMNVGRSEVQIFSPITGQLLGEKEIIVSSDKEALTHLNVNLITGLETEVKPFENFSNVWMSKTISLSRFNSKYQEGLLDIDLLFSDGSLVSLMDITSSDYNLLIESNSNVLVVAPGSGSQSRLIAINPGQGKLINITLGIDNQCQNKKAQPLIATSTNVIVDFSTSTIQNDAFNYKRSVFMANQTGEFFKYDNLKKFRAAQMKSHLNANKPSVQAPKNLIIQKTKVSSLEVGMYSILGIFLLAVLLLVVCSAFTVYFKPKSPQHTVTTTKITRLSSTNRPIVANASDWVWLGKSTLKRNAIGKQSLRTLIPENDCNGNPLNSIDDNEINCLKGLKVLKFEKTFIIKFDIVFFSR